MKPVRTLISIGPERHKAIREEMQRLQLEGATRQDIEAFLMRAVVPEGIPASEMAMVVHGQIDAISRL